MICHLSHLSLRVQCGSALGYEPMGAQTAAQAAYRWR